MAAAAAAAARHRRRRPPTTGDGWKRSGTEREGGRDIRGADQEISLGSILISSILRKRVLLQRF